MKKAKLKEKLEKKRAHLTKTKKKLAKTRSKLKELQAIVDSAAGVKKSKFPSPVTSEAEAAAAAETAALAVKGQAAGQNGQ